MTMDALCLYHILPMRVVTLIEVLSVHHRRYIVYVVFFGKTAGKVTRSLSVIVSDGPRGDRLLIALNVPCRSSQRINDDSTNV